MQKTLQEIQAENRRLILEAVHGCSYEEALEQDFLQANSQFTIFTGYRGDFNDIRTWLRNIGKPITLSRVLLAFKNTAIVEKFYWASRDYIIEKWDLTKETLGDQSEETQRAIHQLLTQ
jgi:hypothetical protein